MRRKEIKKVRKREEDEFNPIKRAEKMVDKARAELFLATNLLMNPPKAPDHAYKMKVKELIQDAEISIKISLENLFA
jgi:predicted metal-binding protein|tara:strand:+ start:482 stop:712 length:231 start_codon:yes stop_codon:yes gene_type:complete